MVSRIEIFKSNSFNPYENLAIEKYLFDTVNNDVLRLFLWQNNNTVVIGANQNPWAECNCALFEAEGGFVARRLSGGGAVYHDKGNLNYTFICSEENYNLETNLKIIKKACEYANIFAEVSGRNDILVKGKKISGNAFYHSKGKAYHHGTLLIASKTEKLNRYLTPKQEKLNSKGVKSVEARVVNLNQFNPILTPSLLSYYLIKSTEQIFGLQSTLSECPENEQIESNIKHFSSWNYIYGKTPPFSVCLKKQFSWGNLEINLNLTGGKISDIKVFTDSMDFTLAEKVETALIGSEFNTTEIEMRLHKSVDTLACNDILQLIRSFGASIF